MLGGKNLSVIIVQMVNMISSIMVLMNGILSFWVVPGTGYLTPAGSQLVYLSSTMLLSVLSLVDSLLSIWVVPSTGALTPAGASLLSSLSLMVQNTVYFINQVLTAMLMV